MLSVTLYTLNSLYLSHDCFITDCYLIHVVCSLQNSDCYFKKNSTLRERLWIETGTSNTSVTEEDSTSILLKTNLS